MTQTPENLAKALEVMTFRVAELEAELEAKSRLWKTCKAMLFSSRTEKARIVLDEQGSLDLGDLSVIAPPRRQRTTILLSRPSDGKLAVTSALCPSICHASAM